MKESTTDNSNRISEDFVSKDSDLAFYRILADNLNFPEGPAFDSHGNLWCTEMGAENIIRWGEKQTIKYPCNGRPNGMTFDNKDRIWICDSRNNSIRRFEPNHEQWETIIDKIQDEPLQTPNDLAFDISGNLIFTCPNFVDLSKKGYVGCLSPEGEIIKIVEEMYRPNGIAFTENGKYIVIADTLTKELYRGVWNPTERKVMNLSTWAYVGGQEGPDGMAYSSDGSLFCAIYGDSIIKLLNQDGKIINNFYLPGRHPTNAALDHTGNLGLVVTESEAGMLLSFPNIKSPPEIFDGGIAWF